jgi:hypothetical protein
MRLFANKAFISQESPYRDVHSDRGFLVMADRISDSGLVVVMRSISEVLRNGRSSSGQDDIIEILIVVGATANANKPGTPEEPAKFDRPSPHCRR